MINVLIVDDEEKICEFIKAFLDNEGYCTEVTYDGKSAIDKINSKKYDLIILDRMLPYVSGEEICKYIRSKSEVPIIMLTARIEDEDKINGFNLGCDDYICKPFDIHELLARIKVQLRQYEPKQRQLIYKDWTIDLDLMTLNAAGQSIDLTSLEFKIIELFMRYPQKVFTKENIYEYVWEDDYVVGDKTIHVHISNIRTKLKSTGTDHYIQTVWGMGFKLID